MIMTISWLEQGNASLSNTMWIIADICGSSLIYHHALLTMNIQRIALSTLQLVACAWWLTQQPDIVEWIPWLARRGQRFLVCIMIELTPQCDMGLLDQPSNTWHTLECVVRMKMYIHSYIYMKSFSTYFISLQCRQLHVSWPPTTANIPGCTNS